MRLKLLFYGCLLSLENDLLGQTCCSAWAHTHAESKQLHRLTKNGAKRGTHETHNHLVEDPNCFLQTEVFVREQPRSNLHSQDVIFHNSTLLLRRSSRSQTRSWWDGFVNTVSNVVNTVGSWAKWLKDSLVEQTFKIFANLISLPGEYPPGATVEAGGHSTACVNAVFCVAVAIVLLFASIGWTVDVYYPKWAPTSGRPSATVLGILIGSYCLLIPGIFSTLFSFNVVINVFGKQVASIYDENGNPAPLTESAASLVRELFASGAITGAVLLITYAMVVPILKLILLACGEYWRFSDEPYLARRSYLCIKIVQVVSKWASPDMFAYILIWYLVQSMDGGLVQALTQLDIGFVCFSLFCMLTTLSSLAIPLPRSPWKPAASTNPLPARVELRMAVIVFGIASIVLAGIGLRTPCLALRVDTALVMDQLMEEIEDIIPSELMSIVEPTIQQYVRELQQQVQADVNLWSCMLSLLSSQGVSASFLLGFVLLGCFAVVIPVLNVLVLMGIACHWSPSDFFSNSTGKRLLTITRVLSHVSMLDVLVMGIFVVVFAGGIYEEKGVKLSLQPGFFFLLGAEVAHYCASILALEASGLINE